MVECFHNACASQEFGDHLAGYEAVQVDGLNSGASTRLLASMTIRPAQAGKPVTAAASFDHDDMQGMLAKKVSEQRSYFEAKLAQLGVYVSRRPQPRSRHAW
jgi:hypothetical protein